MKSFKNFRFKPCFDCTNSMFPLYFRRNVFGRQDTQNIFQTPQIIPGDLLMELLSSSLVKQRDAPKEKGIGFDVSGSNKNNQSSFQVQHSCSSSYPRTGMYTTLTQITEPCISPKLLFSAHVYNKEGKSSIQSGAYFYAKLPIENVRISLSGKMTKMTILNVKLFYQQYITNLP